MIGPVGVFKLVGISNDLVMSHIVLTILSLSMGLSNLLPIKLFDGSQLHAVVLDKYVGITWRQHILNFVTVVLFGTLAFVMIRSEFNGAVRFWIAGAITFMFAANYVNMRARLVAQALQHV